MTGRHPRASRLRAVGAMVERGDDRAIARSFFGKHGVAVVPRVARGERSDVGARFGRRARRRTSEPFPRSSATLERLTAVAVRTIFRGAAAARLTRGLVQTDASRGRYTRYLRTDRRWVARAIARREDCWTSARRTALRGAARCRRACRLVEAGAVAYRPAATVVAVRPVPRSTIGSASPISVGEPPRYSMSP
jgi:hypothetical protein